MAELSSSFAMQQEHQQEEEENLVMDSSRGTAHSVTMMASLLELQTQVDGDALPNNQYLDSLKLLEMNRQVLYSMSEKLDSIERETSSIVTELDDIESKISPMLRQHVPDYDKKMRSLDDGNDHCVQSDDTTATCSTSVFSKAHSEQHSPQQSPSDPPSVYQYINLADLEVCLLPEEEHSHSESELFSSYLSSITLCPSTAHPRHLSNPDKNLQASRSDSKDHGEGTDRFDSRLLDRSGIQESFLKSSGIDPVVVLSTLAEHDDLSEMSGLSVFGSHNFCSMIDTSSDGKIQSKLDGDDGAATDDTNTRGPLKDDSLCNKPSPIDAQKDCLGHSSFNFTDDVCLLKEPTQDLSIPASFEDDEDPPCFILGAKKRSKEDECNCVIS